MYHVTSFFIFALCFFLSPWVYAEQNLAPKEANSMSSQVVLPWEAPITVMTYNVYVGSSSRKALEINNISQIPVIVSYFYKNIVASDFVARAQSIAENVKIHQPHVIALQEISLIRRQDLSDYFFTGTPNAQKVDMDFLAILTEALQAKGLNYQVAAQVQNFDLEMPMFSGSGLEPVDIRLTDFNVTLVRDDVLVSQTTSVNYQAKFPAFHGNIEVEKGFVAIDAEIDGIKYRVVNTHLEPIDSKLRIAQVEELIKSLESETMPIILLGTFNSPAVHGSAYQKLIESGYQDMVSLEADTKDTSKWNTCCQAENLRNEESELSKRIDFIFMKNMILQPLSTLPQTFVIGNKVSDREAIGGWPSDHAGVVSIITPPPLP